MVVRTYKVIRSNRKTILLVINNNAELIIRAPYIIDDNTINDIVVKKEKWIINKQREIIERKSNEIDISYTEGGKFRFLGEKYIIILSDVKKIELLRDKLFIPNVHREKIKYSIYVWLYEKAEIMLRERIEYFSRLMRAEYNKVSLSNAKTRWGSCSGKNSINLSWRLIMCPLAVIDYVVIHELSHIRYKNHSKLFWNEVSKYSPNYKDAKKWLKDNQNSIMI